MLAWQFPDPHNPISSSTRLGVNMVYVKLSDYGSLPLMVLGALLVHQDSWLLRYSSTMDER